MKLSIFAVYAVAMMHSIATEASFARVDPRSVAEGIKTSDEDSFRFRRSQHRRTRVGFHGASTGGTGKGSKGKGKGGKDEAILLTGCELDPTESEACDTTIFPPDTFTTPTPPKTNKFDKGKGKGKKGSQEKNQGLCWRYRGRGIPGGRLWPHHDRRQHNRDTRSHLRER